MHHFNRLLVAFSHIKLLGECDLSLAQWVGLSSLQHTGRSGRHKVLSNNCWLGMPTGTLTYVSQPGLTCLYYLLKIMSKSVLKDPVLWV